MATKTASRATQKYDRNKLVKDLKYTAAMVEASLKSYEEDLADWRENVAARLAEAVYHWQGENFSHFHFNADPPKRNQACSDWRIQRINRSISRLETMVDDVVALRADDPIFDDIQLGACL